MELHAVILAGGRGERFWPLSRNHRPKQLLRLLGDDTLVGATVRRAGEQVAPERIWIVAGQDLRESMLEIPLGLGPEQFIWESVGRNTAAAIGAAAERILRDGDGDVLVLPSDHWIPESAGFWNAVDGGRNVLAGRESLVTFGIRPAYAETGYGYIERGEAIETAAGAFAVTRFHEKPDAVRAAEYLAQGGFYWNSGIFLFRASTIADQLRRCIPEIAPVLDRLRLDLGQGPDEETWPRYFTAAPSISFDHGVMERASTVVVIETDFVWSDLGNWTALGELLARDESGNRKHGLVLSKDTENCILLSEPGGLLGVLGVKDLIVVRVGDATLVCPADRAQEVRRLVQEGRADDLFRAFF